MTNKTKNLFEQARNLDLNDVLKKLGGEMEPCKIGHTRTWRIAGSKFSVKGHAWCEIGGEMKNGGGAIDLVCAINNCTAREALNFLLNLPSFNSPLPTQKLELTVIESVVPTADPSTWRKVRTWLIETRKLDAEIVDQLHQEGQIFSDNLNNAIFMCNVGGDVGCELRGTGLNKFAGCRGGRGLFELKPIDSATPIAIVESAIDAISLRELGYAGRIVSCGGNLTQRTIDYVRTFENSCVGAFDNDETGDSFARRLNEELGSKRMSPQFDLKDWNDVLIVQKSYDTDDIPFNDHEIKEEAAEYFPVQL